MDRLPKRFKDTIYNRPYKNKKTGDIVYLVWHRKHVGKTIASKGLPVEERYYWVIKKTDEKGRKREHTVEMGSVEFEGEYEPVVLPIDKK